MQYARTDLQDAPQSRDDAITRRGRQAHARQEDERAGPAPPRKAEERLRDRALGVEDGAVGPHGDDGAETVGPIDLRETRALLRRAAGHRPGPPRPDAARAPPRSAAG